MASTESERKKNKCLCTKWSWNNIWKKNNLSQDYKKQTKQTLRNSFPSNICSLKKLSLYFSEYIYTDINTYMHAHAFTHNLTYTLIFNKNFNSTFHEKWLCSYGKFVLSYQVKEIWEQKKTLLFFCSQWKRYFSTYFIVLNPQPKEEVEFYRVILHKQSLWILIAHLC